MLLFAFSALEGASCRVLQRKYQVCVLELKQPPADAGDRLLTQCLSCPLWFGFMQVGALANAAGVGGGALYIPLFNVLIGFSEWQ